MTKLYEYRKSIKKTATEMAIAIGIGKSLYYKIESGEREPSYKFLKKFRKAFKVSVDEMFFDN
jgi:putative transcriptional regulator